MATKISTSPSIWAKALGMVAVPLFGPERRNEPGDEHAILLDGPTASLAFTVGDSSSLLELPNPLDWAWSSNLTLSLILDRGGNRLFSRRWDRTEESPKEWVMPVESEVPDFYAELTRDSEPSAETVVEKLLKVFWALRGNIEKRNGTDTDLIRSFNAILVWADSIRQGAPESNLLADLKTLREIVPVLNKARLIDFTLGDLSSDSVRSFPAGAMLGEIIDRDPNTNVALDPDLFIRHASGILYEEAHIELASRPLIPRHERQGELFSDNFSLDATPPSGQPARDIHFTPPSLARTLMQEGLRALKSARSMPRTLKVLDPACGSGVFLIEAARESATESNSELRLIGIDRSPISQIMTEFCLGRIDSTSTGAKPRVSVTQGDSLEIGSWGQPDLVLMNPPFIAWEDMNQRQQSEVRVSLGSRYARLPDYSYAFIAKAIDSLRSGSVLASVVPAAFLDSTAALRLRRSIQSDETLSVQLVGKFRGFRYFRRAIVEPAVIVIARMSRRPRDKQRTIRMVLANSGYEDSVVRAMRRDDMRGDLHRMGWEIYDLDANELSPDDWTPLPRRTLTFLRSVTEAGVPKVADLFDVTQGIQTGNNPVFVLAKQEAARYATDLGFSQVFRPVANDVRDGRIIESDYVFYPYLSSGNLVANSEDELRQLVPDYYRERLEPNRKALSKREGLRGRPWWVLNWPRTDWQTLTAPRLLSSQFGGRGSFAFDEGGRFVVHSGNAWFWKHGNQFHNGSRSRARTLCVVGS
jgi:hypothetical protein